MEVIWLESLCFKLSIACLIVQSDLDIDFVDWYWNSVNININRVMIVGSLCVGYYANVVAIAIARVPWVPDWWA
jgi:hypothetical protein